MAEMAKFNTNFGDYTFSCVREKDGTYTWSKRFIASDAEFEPIDSLEDVPLDVLKSFTRTKNAALSLSTK